MIYLLTKTVDRKNWTCDDLQISKYRVLVRTQASSKKYMNRLRMHILIEIAFFYLWQRRQRVVLRHSIRSISPIFQNIGNVSLKLTVNRLEEMKIINCLEWDRTHNRRLPQRRPNKANSLEISINKEI